jgi:hypothetical protein
VESSEKPDCPVCDGVGALGVGEMCPACTPEAVPLNEPALEDAMRFAAGFGGGLGLES